MSEHIQVTGLPPGVRGACLNSNMTPAQRNGVLADVNAGKVHFLLVSPEAVIGGGGRGQGSFPSSNMLPPIFFACIDEVHCLSEWSHNFRPSYLRLCKVSRADWQQWIIDDDDEQKEWLSDVHTHTHPDYGWRG